MELKAFEYELKVEEQNGTMAELAGQKQKLAVENGKLRMINKFLVSLHFHAKFMSDFSAAVGRRRQSCKRFGK